jgi:hypothetical protein
MADVIVASLTGAGMGHSNEILHSESLEYAGIHFIMSLSKRVLSHMQPASARYLAVF